MGKYCEGRVEGHHITPGRGWRWQQFGGRLMLVTDGGGADVVLSFPVKSDKPVPPGELMAMTCNPEGHLIPFVVDSPLGMLLEAVPDLVFALRDVRTLNDRPRQIPMIEAALAKAGLL